MKLAFKVGDKVKVLRGKYIGKEAVIQFIDKRSNRCRLDGLKKIKVKTKKDSKELHGTFHITSLQVIKAEAPAAAEGQSA